MKKKLLILKLSNKYIDKVNRFLKQKVEEKSTSEETLQQLQALFR